MQGSLEQVPLEEKKIIERVETYYQQKKVESPGVESKDIAKTILNPVKNPK